MLSLVGHHGPVPCAAFLPRSEDPTSRTSNKKRRTKQLDILKEDGGREEKRRGKQSSRTSEHAITGRVATAKGKMGGAIRVHNISPMEHINRNLYFFILAQMLRDARIELDSCHPVFHSIRELGRYIETLSLRLKRMVCRVNLKECLL